MNKHEPAPHETAQLSLAQEKGAQLAAPSDQPAPLNVAAVLEAAVKGGVTGENVSVVKELVALQERMEARAAEKAFARAFNALQAEMPSVIAKKPVMNSAEKGGGVRYVFAPFEDIMEQVRPFLLKHGFTVSFSMQANDGRVTIACTLMHVDGHSKTNASSVRIGKGPPGSTETQADGAASTYAKRFALCDALNIVIEKDNDGTPEDAKNLGAPIDRDRVTVLKEQIAELGGDACQSMVLQLAGVQKLEDIGEAQYPVIIRALEMRRAKKK